MQVDFYLYATHEVATAAPVLATLRAWGINAAFVLEPPDRHIAWGSAPDPQRGWLDDKRRRIVPLVDERIHGELTELVRRSRIPLLSRPRRDADAAVTTQGRGWLRLYDCRYVRLGYGVGFLLDSYGHGDINRGFDLVLAHGRFSASAMRASVGGVRPEGVGYPKWARFIRGEMSTSDARGALGVETQAPTLVYTPTWAHRSSVDDMASVLQRLARDWQVVVKPHHNSGALEPGRFEALDEFLATPDDIAVRHDLVPYIAAADVVIADAVSGAFTEALLARRPVVGITRDAHNLHPAAAQCAPIVADPTEIPKILDAQPWHRHSRTADWWADHLFAPSGGADDERAANAIVQCASRPARRLGRRAENRARRLVGTLARGVRSRSSALDRDRV